MAASKTFTYKIVTAVNINPLQALNTALTTVANSVNNLNKAIFSFGKNFKSNINGAKTQVSDLTDSLKKLALTLGAIGAIKYVAGSVFDFGKKVVEAAKFRQTAVSSLDLFYNGRGGAMFGNLINMANKTPADTKPLLDFATQLSGSGFSEKQLNKLTALRADVEASGANTSVMDSMASVLMAAAGGGAPELGSDYIQKFLGKDRYVRYQAKAAGVNDWEGGNLEQLNKKVNDARKSGKLTGTAMVQGLEEAALDRMKSVRIGDMSERMAKGSIAGAMSNLSNVFDNMLFTTDFENMPGIKAFVKVVNEIVETLTGPEFQGALKDVIGALFKPFESFKEGAIKGAMMWLLETAKALWTWLGKAYEFLKKLLVSDTAGALKDIFVASADAFVYLGKLIGKGIKASFFGGGDDDAPVNHGGSAIEPPKKGEAVRVGGVYLTEDDLDLDKPRPIPAGMEGPQPIIINNHVEVNGDADPKEVAKQVESGTTSALNKSKAQKNLRKAGRSGVND